MQKKLLTGINKIIKEKKINCPIAIKISPDINDNDMSIAKPVGAMRAYLAKILSGKLYFSFRETVKLIISAFSKRFSQKAGKAEDLLRNIVTGGTLFSELGFYYVGPIDGHDVENLVQIFDNVKNSNHQGPVLIHVRTQKVTDRKSVV